jgi:2-oxoisovalerate dehydrogenase E1 component
MDPIGLFSLFSGWRILAPSNAFDYVGLFNSAMVCRDPVLIAEHHQLYGRKFEIPSDELDYYVRIGKARMLRQGKDVSVVCYSSTVDLVSRAAESLGSEGVAVEVIDLRTVSPRDIDYETIGDSLKRTGVLVTVEQAPASMCLGPVITHQCQERFFDYLDGPIQTVSSLDIPLPVSKKLEAATVPDLESVKSRIRKAAQRRF